jgi:hypothetical protein
MTNHKNTASKRHNEDSKKCYKIELFKILYNKPMSRRMSATELGFADQTYVVTQSIFDWSKEGKAHVVGSIKCSRSNRFVEAITTNPELFPKSNQLNLF